ncbi:unnamed protein product [Orchesella dallaii]|uniref:Uncharacterized protein n=1 Tax=Orchesella dallaii TaxID=48710 RepID=A0ABP1R0S1_9HEXA
MANIKIHSSLVILVAVAFATANSTPVTSKRQETSPTVWLSAVLSASKCRLLLLKPPRNSSDAAWTSAMARVGMIPAHWASNGLRITEYPAVIQGPWPSGAGSSPTYASHNCVTIQRVCVRPQGVPIPGCFPARTQFNYSPCNVQKRYICEKRI